MNGLGKTIVAILGGAAIGGIIGTIAMYEIQKMRSVNFRVSDFTIDVNGTGYFKIEDLSRAGWITPPTGVDKITLHGNTVAKLGLQSGSLISVSRTLSIPGLASKR